MPDVRQPKWLHPAKQELDELNAEFDSSLRRIAVRLARHERADGVSARHVGIAFETLARLGLSRQPWWQRPQLKVTVGAAFAAAALATPDFAPLWFEAPQYQAVAAFTSIFVCAALGTMFYLWGWVQERL